MDEIAIAVQMQNDGPVGRYGRLGAVVGEMDWRGELHRLLYEVE